MTPNSAGYAEMTKCWRDVNVLTAADMRSTFHGYDLSIKRDEHIDYCFIKGGVTALTQEIIDATVDEKFPSDHFGVYSEIEI